MRIAVKGLRRSWTIEVISGIESVGVLVALRNVQATRGLHDLVRCGRGERFQKGEIYTVAYTVSHQ